MATISLDISSRTAKARLSQASHSTFEVIANKDLQFVITDAKTPIFGWETRAFPGEGAHMPIAQAEVLSLAIHHPLEQPAREILSSGRTWMEGR